ncbi:phosphatase PAP2 family protein [Kitasatospora sp. NPDC059327]|uniref:phosphatase PAP2 family protein n=1 Tax=Kitasatospora sp. NPDC059327 TaxID=3346803 RepID=UPI00367B2BEC
MADRMIPRRAAPWIAVCAVAFAVIGATRVYLGVHWPLDVLGGWLLAAAWLLLGSALLRTPGRPEPEEAPTDRSATSM